MRCANLQSYPNNGEVIFIMVGIVNVNLSTSI